MEPSAGQLSGDAELLRVSQLGAQPLSRPPSISEGIADETFEELV
jgi:hypothetical protein